MRKIKISKLKLLLAAVLICLVGVIYWAYDVAPTANNSPEIKYVTYENNTIKEEVDGKLVWEFTVGKMSLNPSTQKATIENVKGKFYSEDGREITLVADNGEYDESTRNIKFTKGLKITSNDNLSFTTKELVWDNNDRSLKAVGQVEIKKPGLVAKADEASSTDNFKNFRLKGNARIIKGAQ